MRRDSSAACRSGVCCRRDRLWMQRYAKEAYCEIKGADNLRPHIDDDVDMECCSSQSVEAIALF